MTIREEPDITKNKELPIEIKSGYRSPGIISPGGGLPCLALQNSHSVDLEHDDMTFATVPNGDNLWVFKPAENGNNLALKLRPDSPFDVASSQREFHKVSEILMLECNNPKNLFKVLKGVCAKLKLENPKYRRIDSMNSAVQHKLLRFEGVEEFLMLLGYKKINKHWVCDMDQPPLSVLESAINVCNDCLLKCNQKRATIDMIKKFSKHDLGKKKRKQRKKKKRDKKKELKHIEEESKEIKIEINVGRTRNGSVKVDGTIQPITPSISIDNKLVIDDIKFEEELEGGEEDRFILSDIIWSVTHKDNTDKDARNIILLCFPTFSDEYKLIKCLIDRFFEPDSKQRERSNLSRESSVSFSGSLDDEPSSSFNFNLDQNINHIESLWETQVKVISFMQQWMRSYWAEDWDENSDLLDIVDKFSNQITICYKNDHLLNNKERSRGMKLTKMIHQTMQFQRAALIKKRKQTKNMAIEKQSSIPSKLVKLHDLGSAVNKMRYDFVKLDNKRLAEQITLLDFKYFKAIQQRECLGQAWKKRNKYEIASNICALIDQFNKMSKWVQATILLAKNVKTRGRLIKKFIKISNHLLQLRNFQSLCAFHGALSSVPIHKLKHAWSYVPAKHVARFEEMRVIFNTRNNMANLRKLHREAHAPLVPYTGIFLSDLVSIEEGNKKHKDDGTVNFAKLMRLSEAIDNILLYQRTRYEITDNYEIQQLLLDDFKINAKLDQDYIYKFSSEIARKDQPLKKKVTLKSLFK